MINVKPPEEEKPVNLFYQRLEEESESEPTDAMEKALKKLNPDTYYLKEISKTLKEILREMRERKC